MHAPFGCNVYNERDLPLQIRKIEDRAVWLFGLQVIELGHFLLLAQCRSNGSGKTKDEAN